MALCLLHRVFVPHCLTAFTRLLNSGSPHRKALSYYDRTIFVPGSSRAVCRSEKMTRSDHYVCMDVSGHENSSNWINLTITINWGGNCPPELRNEHGTSCVSYTKTKSASLWASSFVSPICVSLALETRAYHCRCYHLYHFSLLGFHLNQPALLFAIGYVLRWFGCNPPNTANSA